MDHMQKNGLNNAHHLSGVPRKQQLRHAFFTFHAHLSDGENSMYTMKEPATARKSEKKILYSD